VGRPPFLAEGLERTLAMVLVDDPLPPRRFDPGIPRDLETVCLKCLEKDPDRRYASANQLADELGRISRGEPIRARPIGLIEKTLRWTLRNRRVASLAASVVIALFLGATGVFWQWQRAERNARNEHWQRTRAEASIVELQQEEAENLLNHGESAKALLLLAGTLRSSPTNRLIAERMLSVMTQRRFPLPGTPLLHHQGPILDAAFNTDGTLVATASDDGTVSIWDTAFGERSVGPIANDAGVNSVRFMPEGDRIVTASKNGFVRLWQTETGLPDGDPLVHSNGVVGIEIHPDGRMLLATTRDRKVIVWRLADRAPVFPPISHDAQVSSARFSPDGTRFVTTSQTDGLVRVFETASGRLLHSKVFKGWVLNARFSRDGQRLAIASYNKWGTIWNPTGTPETVTVWHADVVNDAMFSPDGELFATISRDRRALVWDSRTGDLVFSLPPHFTWVEEVAFRSDGLSLITREEGNRVVIWDLLTGSPALEPVHFHSSLTLMRLAPDGRTLLLGAVDGSAQIWNIAPAEARPVTLRHGRSANTATFSPDGRQVLTGTYDGRAILWDAAQGTAIRGTRHQSQITVAQFSPDGSHVLTASQDAIAKVWNPITGKSVTVRHQARILATEFSPDGRSFLTASFDGTARTWDTGTGEPVSRPMKGGGRLWHAAFSRDGSLVATASEDMVRQTDHQARIWNAHTGEPVTPPLRHGEGVFRVSFHPGGRILASASRDNTAALWSVDSGTRLLTIRHDGPISFVEFSPDGTRLLTGSLDNTARIWDSQTGRQIGETMRHAHEIHHAAWSPDGRRVATGCEDGSARVWDASTGRPVTEFLWHLTRVSRVEFSPNSRRLLCASRHSQVWDLPCLAADPPDWLPFMAEAVAGLRGSVVANSPGSSLRDLFSLRDELTSRSDEEPLIPWARSFFGRGLPATHGSRSTNDLPTYIVGPNLINPSSWAALRDIHRDPSDRTVWHRLFKHVLDGHDPINPFRSAQAEYFSRKSVTTAPAKLEHWLDRIEWLKESRRDDLRAEAMRHAAQQFPDAPQFQDRK
jgi:WD40 repeat protein